MRITLRQLRWVVGSLIVTVAFAVVGYVFFPTDETGSIVSRKSRGYSALPTSPKPVFLTVWHDKGDDGDKYLQELNQMYQKINPNVELRYVSFSAARWLEETAQALTSGIPPDLVFNDASRIIEVQGRTGKFIEMDEVLAQTEGKNFAQEGDLETAMYKGQLIVLPVNRVMTGLGVRKSVLAEAGVRFPETWDEFLTLAQRMTTAGRYGFTFQLMPGDSSEMVQMLMYGSGLRDVWFTNEPALRPHFLEPDRMRFIKEIAKLYNTYRVMPQEAINQDYTQMYEVVESGKAAMFRVGNWDLKHWDNHKILGSDYEVGPFPALEEGLKRSFVLGNVRGFAIPEMAPNVEHAKQFVKSVLSLPAQESSFRYFGSSLRSDLQMTISPVMRPFFDPKYQVQTADIYNNQISYYDELNNRIKKMMSDIYTSPSESTELLLRQGAADLEKLIGERAGK